VSDRPRDDAFTTPHFESAALVVIDVQNDFLDGGSSPVPGTSDRLTTMRTLIEAFRAARCPIVHVIRLYEGADVDLVRRAALLAGAPIVKPDSGGAQIARELLPSPDVQVDAALLLSGALQPIGDREHIMWKPRWSAFYRTTLQRSLADWGADTVVIAGCNFPNCPRATIFDASERDLRVVVAEDAISQVTSDRLADALGLGAVAMPARDIVTALRVAS